LLAGVRKQSLRPTHSTGLKEAIHFGRYAAGSGLSSVLAFLTAVVLARWLEPGQFAGVSLVLASAVMVSMLGAGVDSAAARLVARGPLEDGIIRTYLAVARTWRLGLLILSSGVIVLVFIAAPSVRLIGIGPALVAWLLLTLGLSMMGLALIKPTAVGAVGSYTIYQLGFYLPLFLGVCVAFAIRASVSVTLLVMALAGIAFVVWYVWENRASWRFALTVPGYTRIAGTMLVSTALFAVFTRLDVFYVSLFLPPREAGHYAAAVRLAGGMAVATGAFATFAVPRISRVKTPVDLKRAYRRLVPVLLLIGGGAAVMAGTAGWTVPFLFGQKYDAAIPWLRLLAIQYPLAAACLPISYVYPFLGKARWQWEQNALVLGVAVFCLVISARRLPIVAISASVAEVAACVYAFARYKQLSLAYARSEQ